jgi:surfeit locus 1 family protein
MCEIEGIVRRGENEDWLKGRRNWPREGIFNWVDLDFMARFFRVFNMDSAKAAYIERVVSSSEDETYPLPSTKESFDKPLITP